MRFSLPACCLLLRFTHLTRDCRFIMAQVVEVLDDLHRKQFIYRRVSIHASGFFSLTKTLVCSCATLSRLGISSQRIY